MFLVGAEGLEKIEGIYMNFLKQKSWKKFLPGKFQSTQFF
jgi:hypothetical protein